MKGAENKVDYEKILTYTVAVVGVFQGLTTIIVNIQKMKNPNNKKRPNQPSTKRRKGRK